MQKNNSLDYKIVVKKIGFSEINEIFCFFHQGKYDLRLLKKNPKPIFRLIVARKLFLTTFNPK